MSVALARLLSCFLAVISSRSCFIQDGEPDAMNRAIFSLIEGAGYEWDPRLSRWVDPNSRVDPNNGLLRCEGRLSLFQHGVSYLLKAARFGMDFVDVSSDEFIRMCKVSPPGSCVLCHPRHDGRAVHQPLATPCGLGVLAVDRCEVLFPTLVFTLSPLWTRTSVSCVICGTRASGCP